MANFLQIKRLWLQREIGLFWRSLFADFLKGMTIVQFYSFKWIFLKANFNSKRLFKHLSIDSTHKHDARRWAREIGAWLHCFTGDENNQGSDSLAVNALTVWEGVRAPAPFPRPPLPGSCIESQITAGSVWRELTIMKYGDGCLKKTDYLSVQVLVKDG